MNNEEVLKSCVVFLNYIISSNVIGGNIVKEVVIYKFGSDTCKARISMLGGTINYVYKFIFDSNYDILAVSKDCYSEDGKYRVRDDKNKYIGVAYHLVELIKFILSQCDCVISAVYIDTGAEDDYVIVSKCRLEKEVNSNEVHIHVRGGGK